MKTVYIHKAQAISEDHKDIEILNIIAKDSIPSNYNTRHAFLSFEIDAMKIYEAFLTNLPGGTIDQLLLLLLKYKASQFIVPYEYKEETNAENDL